MADDFSVLLVHDQEDPIQSLEQTLRSQGIKTEHAPTCSEASAALRGPRSPGLVLTDTSLKDGTWVNVLDLASAVPGNDVSYISGRDGWNNKVGCPAFERVQIKVDINEARDHDTRPQGERFRATVSSRGAESQPRDRRKVPFRRCPH